MAMAPPRRALFALLALLALSAADAQAAPDLQTYYATDPDRWGAPRVAVAPDYPPEALAEHVTGIVTVSGVIAPTGELRADAYSVDPPQATALVDAVKEVIGHWLFYTPIGKDCMPSEEPAQERIWFEIRDGAPHVSISRAATQRHAEHPSWLEPILKGKFRYPRQMLREGRSAHVYARLKVDAAGSVTAVEANAWPRSDDTSDFEEESKRALAQYTFPPAPEGKSGARTVCYDIIFRLD